MSAEHQQLEWKASWRDEHLKWVCAFANAEGGTLVIGRDDQGRAVGVADARKLMEDLPNKARDPLDVVVQVPEKSNSRLQQYRLTAAGRAHLQALASPEPP